jgi:hypothetical protein
LTAESGTFVESLATFQVRTCRSGTIGLRTRLIPSLTGSGFALTLPAGVFERGRQA